MTIDDILQRILMLALGIIYVVGGFKFAIRSFGGLRVARKAIYVGCAALMMGLLLCLWAFIGPPPTIAVRAP